MFTYVGMPYRKVVVGITIPFHCASTKSLTSAAGRSLTRSARFSVAPLAAYWACRRPHPWKTSGPDPETICAIVFSELPTLLGLASIVTLGNLVLNWSTAHLERSPYSG